MHLPALGKDTSIIAVGPFNNSQQVIVPFLRAEGT